MALGLGMSALAYRAERLRLPRPDLDRLRGAIRADAAIYAAALIVAALLGWLVAQAG